MTVVIIILETLSVFMLLVVRKKCQYRIRVQYYVQYKVYWDPFKGNVIAGCDITTAPVFMFSTCRLF